MQKFEVVQCYLDCVIVFILVMHTLITHRIEISAIFNSAQFSIHTLDHRPGKKGANWKSNGSCSDVRKPDCCMQTLKADISACIRGQKFHSSGLENCTCPLVFTSASGCRASETFDISYDNYFFSPYIPIILVMQGKCLF